jgi:peptide/nickel transport system permease protein
MKSALRLLIVFALVWFAARSSVYFLPGNPADFLVHESLVQMPVEELRQKMQLDQSVTHRLFSLPQTVSLISKQNTWNLVGQGFLNSLILAMLALFFSACSSVFFLYMSFRSDRWRRFAENFSLFCASTPLFILSPVLLLIFSLHLGWFPVTQSPLLPAIALSFYLTGFWFRTLSRKIDSYLPQSAVPGARARGLDENAVFFRYLFYPSLGTFMGFLGTQIGTLLNGSIIVEIIFQWKGLGSILSDAVMSRDYPVIEICLILVTWITLLSQQLGYSLQQKMEPRLS